MYNSIDLGVSYVSTELSNFPTSMQLILEFQNIFREFSGTKIIILVAYSGKYGK